MAEKKSSSKKSSSKKSSGTKSAAKKSSAKKSGASRKTTAAKKTSSSAPRKRAAKKGGQARGRQQKAQKQARTVASAATAPVEFSGKSVAEFRQALSSNLIRPLELVMISRARIEEALDEVVKRGRMTRDDASQLSQVLFTVGRQQTDDVMKDLEQLLGRGRKGLEDRTGTVRDRSVEAARGARQSARRSVGQAAGAARKAADPLLVQADRARRVAGVGPAFPISGYDDLTAAQIQTRLETLTPAELRKVRDYERRRGNRKSVLEAIESQLG